MEKATFNKLPEEILLMIFRNLGHETGKSLLECQKVCRAWYTPSHLVFLEKVIFFSVADVELFLQSIDHNPAVSYLHAVKCFEILDQASPLDGNLSRQLLSRFPNLENITLEVNESPFRGLNNDFYNSIHENCPRIAQINVHQGFRSYHEFLYNFRKTLTTIRMFPADDFVEQIGGSSQFITSFPLLQAIDVSQVHQYGVFTSCLTLFNDVQNLKQLKCKLLTNEDHDDMTLHYLQATDSTEAVFTFLECLCIKTDFPLSLGLIKFIVSHLIELNSLTISTTFNEDWDEEKKTWYRRLLRKMYSLFDFDFTAKMDVDATEDEFIQNIWIPEMIDGTFHQTPNNAKISNKILEISMIEAAHPEQTISVKSFRGFDDQLIRVVQLSLGFLEDITYMPELAVQDVNILSFETDGGPSSTAYFNLLDTVLAGVPNASKLCLKFPPEPSDKDNMQSSPEYPQITHLEILGTWPVDISRFTGLRYLKIYGVDAHTVSLENHALERLDIDLGDKDEKHFFLKVNIISKGRNHLYARTFDDIAWTEVEETDDTMPTIQINVFHLKCLILHRYDSFCIESFDTLVYPFVDTNPEETSEAKLFFYEN